MLCLGFIVHCTVSLIEEKLFLDKPELNKRIVGNLSESKRIDKYNLTSADTVKI